MLPERSTCDEQRGGGSPCVVILATPTRRRWEDEQERLHGCRYVNGQCVEHGGTTIAASEQPKELELLCVCQSFPYAHILGEHDALAGRFGGDTELKRFLDAAPTDWRTLEERQPQGQQLQLIEESCRAPAKGRQVQAARRAKSR
jgi:hypothetical protein